QDNLLDANDPAGKIIYSTDHGATWSNLHVFNHPVFWITLDPSNPNRAYASVIHYNNGNGVGGIYRCDDLQNLAASTWTLLPNPPRTEKHPASIEVLNDGSVVCSYSGRRNGAGTFTASSGVFVYDPVGNSWTDVSDAGMFYWTKDIVIDPTDTNQNTWYAGVFSGWGGPPNGLGGLYKTTNRGISWTRISNVDRVTSCAFDPVFTGRVFMTTEQDGLWVCANINAPVPVFAQDSLFPFRQPERVFFNPYNPTEIWVTTFGNGLYSSITLTIGEETSIPVPIQIWPNPTTGSISLDWKNEATTAFLYDQLGRLVQRINLVRGTNVFELEQPAGIYYLVAGDVRAKLVKH
ncbi:MAG: T9SS type A sorting domain-containing protein, partial [Bacteroidia bacterium]